MKCYANMYKRFMDSTHISLNLIAKRTRSRKHLANADHLLLVFLECSYKYKDW